MTSIMKFLAQFEEEIEGVEEYSMCAVEAKDDPELAKMYMEMASAELGHAQKLQTQMAKKMKPDLDPEEAKKILEDIWSGLQSDMAAKMAKARGYLETVK